MTEKECKVNCPVCGVKLTVLKYDHEVTSSVETRTSCPLCLETWTVNMELSDYLYDNEKNRVYHYENDMPVLYENITIVRVRG